MAIIETMKIASDGLTDSVTNFTKKINDVFKASKTKLDSRVAHFNKSVQNMFNMDTKEKRIFYLGVFGGIATPTVFIVYQIANVIAGFFN